MHTTSSMTLSFQDTCGVANLYSGAESSELPSSASNYVDSGLSG